MARRPRTPTHTQLVIGQAEPDVDTRPRVPRIALWLPFPPSLNVTLYQIGRGGKIETRECPGAGGTARGVATEVSPMRSQRSTLPVVCAHCGTTFDAERWFVERGLRKYCSFDCQRLGRRTRQERTCRRCSTVFHVEPNRAASGRGAYCSLACRRADQAERKLPKRTLLERFEEKYIPEPNSGCWLWIASLRPDGYAQISPGDGRKGMKTAHGVSYRMFVGPVPRGLVLDHLCRVRCCVNPTHLEPVTSAENVRRGNHPNMVKARQSRQVAS